MGSKLVVEGVFDLHRIAFILKQFGIGDGFVCENVTHNHVLINRVGYFVILLGGVDVILVGA